MEPGLHRDAGMKRKAWIAVVVTLGGAAAVGAAMRGHAPAMRPAQRARAQIASHADFHWNMSVAAGGRYAAYANGYGEPGLFVASLDGEPVVERIETDVAMPREPALSPDGRMVAFQSFGDEASLQTLHLHDRRTGRTEMVVGRDARGSLVNDPAWSRDGRFLAYTRSWPAAGGVWQTELHVIAIADRSDRTLLARPARAPAWSPDGTRLAFLSGPDLMLTDPQGKAVTPLARFEPARPAPSLASPDPPAWSPDGRTIAHAVEEDRCHRIYLVDLSGRRRLLADECAMRPVWFPSGDRVAYLRLSGSSRTLWSRSTGGGEALRLGFADGMAYDHGFDAAGALVLLGMPSDHPRALWRVAPGGGTPALLVSSMRPALDPRWVSRPESTTVVSAGGVRVPLQIFPRLCGEARGPALVWLHGGPQEDVAPRWYQEIQYAAAMGMTVVAVNYRGSTGNGKAYRELEGDRAGQIADVVAALEHVRSRADVDQHQIYLFLISWAAAIGYPVVAGRPEAFAGVVDWLGSPRALDELVHRPRLPRLPPMLWVSGTRDPITGHRRALAARARRAGAEIEEVVVDADHAVLPGASRAAALARLEAFLRRRSASPARCDEATTE